MRGGGFAGLGGHSTDQEALEVILRGSFWPCTPLPHYGRLDNDTECVRPYYTSYCLK